MTVHLIAKAPQQSEPTNTTNATNTSSTSQQQQRNTNPNQQQIPPIIPPPLNNNNNNPFGNLMGMFGGLGVPQTTSMTIGNLNDLPSSLNGILGGLGIRLNTTGNNNINMSNLLNLTNFDPIIYIFFSI